MIAAERQLWRLQPCAPDNGIGAGDERQHFAPLSVLFVRQCFLATKVCPPPRVLIRHHRSVDELGPSVSDAAREHDAITVRTIHLSHLSELPQSERDVDQYLDITIAVMRSSRVGDPRDAIDSDKSIDEIVGLSAGRTVDPVSRAGEAVLEVDREPSHWDTYCPNCERSERQLCVATLSLAHL